MPSGKVYLISGVTDMRKSIDGLSLIVAETLEMDPFSESWFIFCNRPRDKCKRLINHTYQLNSSFAIVPFSSEVLWINKVNENTGQLF